MHFPKFKVLLLILFLVTSYNSQAQNIELAKDLYQHKLYDEAKKEFIHIKHSPDAPDSAKAESYYWLGNISFEAENYQTAINDWNDLIKKYPNSSYALEIKDRMNQLEGIIQTISEETTESAIANSYLNNADFWNETNFKYRIDSSWLPTTKLAMYWYDKTIEEFPNTPSARMAYKRKLITLVRKNFNQNKREVNTTFQEFKSMFPESPSLQALRYQVAQGYWKNKHWDEAREWLNKIIDATNDEQTFYSQVAKARLDNLEY